MPVPVISVAEMREWEKASWQQGRKEAEVIRQVGMRLAEQARRLTQPGDFIVILAGKGHNGDDARLAAPSLTDRRVKIVDVVNPSGIVAAWEPVQADRPALVVDGLFGIGLNRPLGPDWIDLMLRLNESGIPVLSVDLPSGLDADTGTHYGAAVEARVTLAVGAPKHGMLLPAGWPFVGRLEVAPDVGLIPCPVLSELWWSLPADFAGYPPARSAHAHKGSFGHLVIMAGSLGYHGAAVLAARGAQRARPGLITLRVGPEVYAPVAGQLQAVMVRPWAREEALPETCTAILVGPGLAAPQVPQELKSQTASLWRDSDLAVVADASALDWLPAGAIPSGAIRVITPHPGEAARMLGCSVAEVQTDRVKAVRALSRRHGDCWVVLKGLQTLIGRTRGDLFVNPSGNAQLAQGGSGDVLGGFLAGMLAQPALAKDPLAALRYAVWQHGAAADHLAEHRRNWVIEDLAECLGNVPGPERLEVAHTATTNAAVNFV